MKTLIKSFALALSLAVVASAATFAAPTEANPIGRPAKVATYKTGVYSTVTGKLNVALDKSAGGRVDIRLKDTTGKVLFAQYLGKKEQVCRLQLNLSDLEDGVYTLEITNGVETTTQSVTIATKQPTLSNRVVALN
ncbi:T9SS type A sorting domain-containing protein [Spirosoma aerophilum]